jgi:hypothetical protein
MTQKFRSDDSVILSLSKDQPPENGRRWRRLIASSAVFPENRIVAEMILPQAPHEPA